MRRKAALLRRRREAAPSGAAFAGRRVGRSSPARRSACRAACRRPCARSRPSAATPFFVKKAQGRDPRRRRRQPLRRLRHVVRAAHLRARARRPVLSAVRKALPRGTSYGAPTQGRGRAGRARRRRPFPSMEKVRFVSSGTEATMSAVRLARARDGPRPRPEVRGLLPRPRRLVPRRGGLRPRDARHPRLARRPGVARAG